MIFFSSFCVTYLTSSAASFALIQCVIIELSLPQFQQRTLLDSLDLQISGGENLIGQHWHKVLPASHGQLITTKGKGPHKAKQGHQEFTVKDVGEGLFLRFQGIFKAHIYTLLLQYKDKWQIRTSLTKSKMVLITLALFKWVEHSVLCYEKKSNSV